MNLVDVKYNGKNNSESIPSILLLHVVNCSSDTNSTNKYPSKLFFSVKLQISLLHMSVIISSITADAELLTLADIALRYSDDMP